jgi:DNA-binding FrmR family transcriptional regulator
MATLTNDSARADILSRLKRAEGQLRGVQRMLEEGTPCLDIAQQFSAVRKALDSTYVRMTMCLLEQELQAMQGSPKSPLKLEPLMADMQKLLTRL